jgi:hypothetical protein
MLDITRAKLQFQLDNSSAEEAPLAAALLEGYDNGELLTIIDTATGDLLFTLNKAN